MTTRNKGAQGFTALHFTVGLIILLVISLLAGYAYRIEISNSREQITQNSYTSRHTNHQPQQVIPSQKTFIVSELGFKMTIPDEIKDLKYVVAGASAYFTTDSLERMDGKNSYCTAGNGALGAIVRLTQDPREVGASYAVSKIVDTFYLIYQTPQQGCSANPATNQLQLSQAKMLQQSITTAVVSK